MPTPDEPHQPDEPGEADEPGEPDRPAEPSTVGSGDVGSGDVGSDEPDGRGRAGEADAPERGAEPARPDQAERITKVLSVLAAVLLGLATVASAWSAYQANRWSGVMATESATAIRVGNDAGKAYQEGDARHNLDTALFVQWAVALMDGIEENMSTVEYLEESLFSEELRVALEAWTESADDVGSPFELEEYTLEPWERGDRLEDESEAAADRSRVANQNSDDYVLLTVVLASVLFLAGIASAIELLRLRVAFLTVAGSLLGVSAVAIATFPVH